MESCFKERKMKVIIMDMTSSWKTLTGEVQQGLVLAPITILVYINDITDRLTSYANMFTGGVSLKPIIATQSC